MAHRFKVKQMSIWPLGSMEYLPVNHGHYGKKSKGQFAWIVALFCTSYVDTKLTCIFAQILFDNIYKPRTIFLVKGHSCETLQHIPVVSLLLLLTMSVVWALLIFLLLYNLMTMSEKK